MQRMRPTWSAGTRCSVPKSEGASFLPRQEEDATGRGFHYDGCGQLREHLAAFVDAYNAKRLKILDSLTSFQAIWKSQTGRPTCFNLPADDLTSRPNTSDIAEMAGA